MVGFGRVSDIHQYIRGGMAGQKKLSIIFFWCVGIKQLDFLFIIEGKLWWVPKKDDLGVSVSWSFCLALRTHLAKLVLSNINQMYVSCVSVSCALFSETLLRRAGSQQAAKFLSNIFTVGQISGSAESWLEQNGLRNVRHLGTRYLPIPRLVVPKEIWSFYKSGKM